MGLEGIEVEIKHEVTWHERLTCTVCRRVFFGACALDAHRPCGKMTWSLMPGAYYMVVPRNGGTHVMYYQHPDGVHVLIQEKDDFLQKQQKMIKARDGKAK